ncbi:MAG: hypothetical protein LBH86_09035 [Oscillospiraceae bacterium]|jgi:hypothetical protein|nr:hypothetical protein [Oscillospiraceae bacterium]
MFINFTNHPSDNWSAEQTAAAHVFGEILDLPFPNVDPNGGEGYIEALAAEYVTRIAAHRPLAVLCQGEMTLTFAVASLLPLVCNAAVLAACSARVVTEFANEDGMIAKYTAFRFTRFRNYLP